MRISTVGWDNTNGARGFRSKKSGSRCLRRSRRCGESFETGSPGMTKDGHHPGLPEFGPLPRTTVKPPCGLISREALQTISPRCGAPRFLTKPWCKPVQWDQSTLGGPSHTTSSRFDPSTHMHGPIVFLLASMRSAPRKSLLPILPSVTVSPCIRAASRNGCLALQDVDDHRVVWSKMPMTAPSAICSDIAVIYSAWPFRRTA